MGRGWACVKGLIRWGGDSVEVLVRRVNLQTRQKFPEARNVLAPPPSDRSSVPVAAPTGFELTRVDTIQESVNEMALTRFRSSLQRAYTVAILARVRATIRATYWLQVSLCLGIVALTPMKASAQLVVDPEAKEILAELANSAAKPRTYAAKLGIELQASTPQGRQYLNQLMDGEFKRSGDKISAFYKIENIVNTPDLPEGLNPGIGDKLQTTRATTLDGSNYCYLMEGANPVVKIRLASGKIATEEINRSVDSEYWDPVAQLFEIRTVHGNQSPETYLRSLIERSPVRARLSLRTKTQDSAVLEATLDGHGQRVFAELSLGKISSNNEWAIRRLLVFAEDSKTILEEYMNEWRSDSASFHPLSYSCDRYSLLSAQSTYTLVASIIIHVDSFDSKWMPSDGVFDCDTAFAGFPNTYIDDVEKRPAPNDSTLAKPYKLPASVGRVPLSVAVQRGSDSLFSYISILCITLILLAVIFSRVRGSGKKGHR